MRGKARTAAAAAAVEGRGRGRRAADKRRSAGEHERAAAAVAAAVDAGAAQRAAGLIDRDEMIENTNGVSLLGVASSLSLLAPEDERLRQLDVGPPIPPVRVSHELQRVLPGQQMAEGLHGC